MLRVLSCLHAEHDHRLVLVAGLICFAATITAFRLHACAHRSKGASRALWLLFTALAAALGMWTPHFIAMLAYDPGLRTGYEPLGTLLSLAIAGSACAVSFIVAAAPRRGLSPLISGALFGLGLAAMHYTGMHAFRTEGFIVWDKVLVGASIAIGLGLAIGGFAVAKESRSWKQQLAGAALLALAICGLHFTGMGAAIIVPDPTRVVPGQLLSAPMMITAVATLSALIVLGGLGTVVIEAYVRQSVQRRLLDAIPEGLAFYDAEDRCLMWNARYAELNAECAPLLKPGVPFASLIQAGVAGGQYPEAQGREAEWIAERIARRACPGAPHEQRLVDGRWLRIEERRISNGGTINICVDITDLKRSAARLETALEGAEAANRAKSEFLANMSHELRTPLNGVVAIASVLARTSLDEQQRELVQVVESSAATLERVLSDVLDLARVDSGKLEIQRQAFDLGEAVRSAAALFETRAKEKGLAFRVQLDPTAEGEIEGDPVRLKQILVNLTSNAVKFTDTGEVVVSVRREEEGPSLLFEVRDTGVGFDEETKARLFNRFEQADGSTTRRFGGTGLGLAISRSLAVLMAGTLEAESELGRGSIFTLRLPLESEAGRKADPEEGLDFRAA